MTAASPERATRVERRSLPSMGSTRTRRSKEGDEQQHPSEPAKESSSSTDRCPQCPENEVETAETTAAKVDWVRCDSCKTWFHWRCVGEGGELEAIDKWYAYNAYGLNDPSTTVI